MNEAQPESIRVIYCDATVQGVEEFGASEPIKLAPKGGGETDFVPPFTCVDENGTQAEVPHIPDTSLLHRFPPAPDCPVLSVTDSLKMVPFGETMRIGIGG